MNTAIQTVHLVPGANLSAYMQTVNSIPLLSAEREHELAEQLYYHENVESARELVMAHLRFVVHIAKSYKGYGLPLADLVQEGNVGLMKAVKRFNPACVLSPKPSSLTPSGQTLKTSAFSSKD